MTIVGDSYASDPYTLGGSSTDGFQSWLRRIWDCDICVTAVTSPATSRFTIVPHTHAKPCWKQPVWSEVLYAIVPASSMSLLLTKTTDPPDDELRAAFEQYGREKNGTGLNASEQLARLNRDFPGINIKCVMLYVDAQLLIRCELRQKEQVVQNQESVKHPNRTQEHINARRACTSNTRYQSSRSCGEVGSCPSSSAVSKSGCLCVSVCRIRGIDHITWY